MTSKHTKGVLDLTFLDIKDENDIKNGLPSRSKHVLRNSIHIDNNNHQNHDVIISTTLDLSSSLKSTNSNSPTKKSL